MLCSHTIAGRSQEISWSRPSTIACSADDETHMETNLGLPVNKYSQKISPLR